MYSIINCFYKKYYYGLHVTVSQHCCAQVTHYEL